ncbi:hypothetical protein BJ170DRAFT_96566 [Xylariales sp. AK1849]|nr:hypothetical protein BJ170DRAFT_96566 [Xylariales sp. AK1849]
MNIDESFTGRAVLCCAVLCCAVLCLQRLVLSFTMMSGHAQQKVRIFLPKSTRYLPTYLPVYIDSKVTDQNVIRCGWANRNLVSRHSPWFGGRKEQCKVHDLNSTVASHQGDWNAFIHLSAPIGIVKAFSNLS